MDLEFEGGLGSRMSRFGFDGFVDFVWVGVVVWVEVFIRRILLVGLRYFEVCDYMQSSVCTQNIPKGPRTSAVY